MSDCNEGRGVTGEEFQAIKIERILERRRSTEERRQKNLQRIRDMKSSEGVHPLHHFPKEIWDQILAPENVSARDLGSAYEVHDLFQEMLETRKVRDILLPQILNLKFSPARKPDPKYRANADYYRYGDDDEDESEDGPENTTPSPLTEFIRLRGISKSMRNSIDQWFEDELVQNLRSEKTIKVPTITFWFSENHEHQERFKKKIEGVLKNFGEDESNCAKRVFFRSLKIRFRNGSWLWGGGEQGKGSLLETFKEFKEQILNLLELIGHQIWRFEFHVDKMEPLEEFGGVPVTEIQICLKKFLESLPNLKWLVLQNREPYRYNSSGVPENFKFPCLPKLERICLFFGTRDYANIFRLFSQVLKANTHVKALNISPFICPYENKKVLQTLVNPLLESLPELSLEMLSFISAQTEKCAFQFLQPLIDSHLNWPLKRMHLGCYLGYSSLKSLFQSLGNFQSLEHLTLRLIDIQFKEDTPFLKLPKLTHLDMDIRFEFESKSMVDLTLGPAANFFFSLQFLLFAKELKELVWKLSLKKTGLFEKLKCFLINNECHEKSINFRGGLKDLRASNLWDCFPQLEKVEVEIQRAWDLVNHMCKRGQKL